VCITFGAYCTVSLFWSLSGSLNGEQAYKSDREALK
jgi:hypothetical protein